VKKICTDGSYIALNLRDCWLLPHCRWYLRPSAIFRSTEW